MPLVYDSQGRPIGDLEELLKRYHETPPPPPKKPSIQNVAKNTAINLGKDLALKKGAELAGQATGLGGGAGGAGLLGGAGSFLGPVAAGVTAYDLFTKKQTPLGGAAKGALAGTMIAPGIGTAIGGLVGLASGFMNKGYSKREEDNRKKLLEQSGINLGEAKAWESNEAFRKSRKESDLTGKDITTAADLYLKLGSTYANAPEEQKAKVAQEALNRGLIREHNGGISLTDQPTDFLDFANKTLQSSMPQQGTERGIERRVREPKKTKKENKAPRVTLSDLIPQFSDNLTPSNGGGPPAESVDYYLRKQRERANMPIPVFTR